MDPRMAYGIWLAVTKSVMRIPDHCDRSRFLVLASQQAEIRNYSRKLYAIRCSSASRSAFLRSASRREATIRFSTRSSPTRFGPEPDPPLLALYLMGWLRRMSCYASFAARLATCGTCNRSRFNGVKPLRYCGCRFHH